MDNTKWNGLSISKFTLGTVQLGMDYGISNDNGKPNQNQAFEILDASKDGGVSVLDTSSDYGDSENVIGKYIKSKGTSSFTIITKFSIHNNNVSEKDVEKCLRKSVETSLERLNVPCLDILLSHNEEDVMRYSNMLPTILKKLKNEGLIKHAGASVNTNAAIGEIIDEDVYEAIQLPFNMFDTARLSDGSLESLEKSNKLVFIRSVFLQGLFFMNPYKLPDGVLQDAKEPLLKIAVLAEKENMSIAELAVQFVLSIPGVSSLVLGVATPEQIKENLKLFKQRTISDKTRHEIINLYETLIPEVIMPWKWNR